MSSDGNDVAAERRAEATSIRALGFAFHRQHFAGTPWTICIGLWRSSGSLLEGGKAVSAVLLTGVSGLAKKTFDLITDFLIMLFTLFFFFEMVNASTMPFTMRFPSTRVIKRPFLIV